VRLRQFGHAPYVSAFDTLKTGKRNPTFYTLKTGKRNPTQASFLPITRNILKAAKISEMAS
jgi:hypothetical protein